MKGARKRPDRTGRPDDAPGFAVRRIAADIVEGVLRHRRSLDDLLDHDRRLAALEDRDRALTRAMVATVLRRLGTLRHLIGLFLERGLPAQAPRVETVLLVGAAQILFLDVPDHAAVDLAVRLARADKHGVHFAGLVNARAAARRPRRRRQTRCARRSRSRHARMADDAVDGALRRRKPRMRLRRRTAVNRRSISR